MDSQGSWIAGFTKSIGSCNPSTAEEWVVFEGLSIAWDLGYRKIELESDALDLVQRLNDVHFE